MGPKIIKYILVLASLKRNWEEQLLNSWKEMRFQCWERYSRIWLGCWTHKPLPRTVSKKSWGNIIWKGDVPYQSESNIRIRIHCYLRHPYRPSSDRLRITSHAVVKRGGLFAKHVISCIKRPTVNWQIVGQCNCNIHLHLWWNRLQFYSVLCRSFVYLQLRADPAVGSVGHFGKIVVLK
jgi:hypothetical protein